MLKAKVLAAARLLRRFVVTPILKTASFVCRYAAHSWKLASLVAFTTVMAVGIGLHVWIYFRHVELSEGKSLEIFAPETSGVIRAENGVPLAKFGEPAYRVMVPYAAIPKHVESAILAAEDSEFYALWHWGINYPRVVKALWTNWTRGRIVSGSSSPTMQVVKNHHIIDRWQKEWKRGHTVSIEEKHHRKRDEASLSFRMEVQEYRKSEGRWWDVLGKHRKAKERIFSWYASLVFLGNLPGGGAPQYGIVAAADFYFDKTIEELTVDEAALLAAAIKDGLTYNPLKNPTLAKARRDFVLSRMLAEGYITEREFEEFAQKPVVVRDLKTNPWNKRDFAPAAVRYAQMQLSPDDQEYGLYADGVDARTTIDEWMQAIANRELVSMFRAYEERHRDQPELLGRIGGTIIVLKNNGDIKAIAEGDNAQRLTRWDGIHPTWWGIGRQPGSAFKLFVQLALLEKGNFDIGPNEEGRPYQLFGGHVAVRMGNGRLHVIRNYKGDRTGYESDAQAFAESHNISHMWAAVNSATTNIDTNDVIEIALRFGVNGKFGGVIKDGEMRYFPTNVIGAGEVPLLKLGLAYAQVANGGCKIEQPRIITEIRRPGKPPDIFPPNDVSATCKKLVSDYVEERMLALLRGPIAWKHGTAYWVLGEGAKITKAGEPIPFSVLIKTGTTNDFTNAWVIISTYGSEGYTVLAWMGFLEGGSIGDDAHGGWKDRHAEPGGRGPGRAAGNVITEIYRNTPLEKIPKVPEASEALIQKAMESFK